MVVSILFLLYWVVCWVHCLITFYNFWDSFCHFGVIMECLLAFLSMGDVTGRFLGTLIAKVGQKGILRSIDPSKVAEMGPRREARNDKK